MLHRMLSIPSNSMHCAREVLVLKSSGLAQSDSQSARFAQAWRAGSHVHSFTNTYHADDA